jgi:ABC-2 type transport system permease protein
MGRILTIAHLTLTDARRRRIVVAALLCAGAFLAVFGTAVFFAVGEWQTTPIPFIRQQATMATLTIAGLYAANFLSVLFAVLLPVDTLSGEVDSGVMQTLASKPIHRADIVLGKWLGHGIIAVAYLTVLVVGVLVIVRQLAAFAPVHVERALPLMMLEVALLLTMAIAGGTRLSTVTNGILALGFYGVGFIGGWIEQVGAVTGITSARQVGIVASLISPPDAMWRLAAYDLQPPIVRDLASNPFALGSVSSSWMVWWALGFTVVTLGWALRSFSRRPL